MVELIINNKMATLAKEVDINIEIENEFFSKSSGYSLDIDLPAREVQNIEIFGPVNRLDVTLDKLEYPAELRYNAKTLLKGKVVIISVNPEIITVQLLSDTSSINYSAKKVYVDEMTNILGRVDIPGQEMPAFGNWVIAKEHYPKLFGNVDVADMVFLWAYDKEPAQVKDKEGQPVAPQLSDNFIFYKKAWGYLNCQPYLVKVIEKIMLVMGYTVTRNDINTSWLRNIYIVNYERGALHEFLDVIQGGVLIYNQLDMTHALPHWKLSEFIEEVENFCACVFVFDEMDKSVQIISLTKYYANSNTVIIPAEDIVTNFEKDTKDSQVNNILISPNIAFEGSYNNKELQVEEKVLKTIRFRVTYKNYGELVTAFNADADYDKPDKLYVNVEDGREYIAKQKEDLSWYLSEINIFANLVRDETVSESLKLKIKPANTQLTNVKWYSDDTDTPAVTGGVEIDVPYGSSQKSELPPYPRAEDIIKNGWTRDNPKSGSMEVMISTGDMYNLYDYNNVQHVYPVPFNDFNTIGACKGKLPRMSLSLKDVCTNSLGHLYRSLPKFSYKAKYVVSFYSNTVPDARSKFIIANKTYACKKLSFKVNNTMTGFLIEGEFYQMLDQ